MDSYIGFNCKKCKSAIETNLELNSEIEELKGELKVANLQMKEKEFKFSRRFEEYENQIKKVNDENKNLKEKYEKIFDTQRKLEKQNSGLEERLLRIVEKYEAEQKVLLEELTIAHSKLVESKLTVEELEKQKEAYRQDCNIAVNLLQCKPGDFVNYSYNSLPVGLKERLKSSLSVEEMLKLEGYDEKKQEYEYHTQKSSNSFFTKIPMFQPTAAAAMMYNVSMQKQQQQQKLKSDESVHQMSKTLSNSSLNKLSLFNVNEISNTSNPIMEISNNGKIPSVLIAQVLRKDNEDPARRSKQLFPYICLRCKKETQVCNLGVQTNASDSNNENLKIVYARKNYNESLMQRAKTVANGLSDLNETSRQQEQLQKDLFSSNDFKDSWTDLDINTVTY